MAFAGEVVTTDANGNELRYTYDTADGPATFAGVNSLAATEVTVANSITDGDGKEHPVTTVGRSSFQSQGSITTITFGDALQEIANDYWVFYGCSALKRLVLPGANYPFLTDPYLNSDVVMVVHPDLVETYQTTSYTSGYRIIAYGAATQATITTTAGSQLQTQVEAAGINPAYLEQLTVSGPLNGTDIDYLHSSMPCLQVLDLRDATIVAGGDEYHQWSVGSNGTATQSGSSTWATQPNTIGERMFSYLPMLCQLVLPVTATVIGDYAVSNCANLVSVTLPEGLRSIGQYAFYYDGKLAQADLPSTLTTIGQSAFYRTALPQVTIPTGVTTLASDLFFNCQSLRTVTLHDGITAIGQYTFGSCSNLEDIGSLPANLVSIGANAFLSDTKLATPIVVPATCKSIGWQAFYGCEAIPLFTFNEGLETIGYDAFYGCAVATFGELPSTVTEIGNEAFSNCDAITEFTFPAAVTEVSKNILGGCDNLERVTLAEGTTKIGSSAFSYCPKLADINLNLPTLTTIGDNAFCSTALVSVSLPNSITSLGTGVFSSCSKLQSVNVPTGVDAVPNNFCNSCPALATVALHSGLTTIGYYAFGSCKQLAAITVDGTPTTALPDGITAIEQSAFNSCHSLLITQLPAQLQRIANYAFYETKALQELTIPAGVQRIDYQAFRNSGITAVTLPEGVTNWGNEIFYNCEQLASVTLPADLKAITSGMFYNTTALTAIDLPAGLETIKSNAFTNSGLQTLTLPQSLQAIEYYAFANTQLTELIIPDGVKEVGEYVAANSKQLKKAFLGHNQEYDNSSFNYFYGCNNLELLRVYAGTPPAINSYYTGYRTNCVLEVPEGQDALYREVDLWKEFKEIRTFFTGDVLAPLDYAVMQKLYRELDGANWKNPWDLSDDHRAVGKWHGVTTEGDYITAIDLTEQGLVGNLPDSLFLLSRLQTLNLSHNRISGDLGRVLSGFPAEDIAPLTELNLQGNHLTGDLSPFAARLPLLTHLDVSYNWLTEISQPISNAVLSSNNFYRGYQFIDWETLEADLPDDAATLVTDITVGVSADIPNSTFLLYRHQEGDYNLAFYDMYRIYKNSWGSLSTSNTELVKDDEGRWNLYSGSSNYVLRARKGQVHAYTHGNPWNSPVTCLLRFDWQDGDVNADQTVDVGDLQSVIHYTLNDQKANGQMFNFTCADVNDDEAINVLDIIGTVDHILAYEEPAASRSRVVSGSPTDSRNLLTTTAATVTLTATDEVAAMQLFVSGPSSGQLHVSENISKGFSVAMRDVAGGVRVIIYSPAGRTLAPGQHCLLHDLPAGAVVTVATLTDAQAFRLPVAITSEANVIDGQIVNGKSANSKLFDLNGRQLSEEWDWLPTGIYIIEVNGKQYKIKR